MKGLLRTLILLLVRLCGAIIAVGAAQKARRRRTIMPRILLIRPDHLGDLVLTTPVLQALKTQAPAAHITMMVGPWSSEVVARHPALDHLITCPFPGFQRTAQRPLAPYILLLSTVQQLWRGNYDLAINLRPDFWWGAALLYLSGIPTRIGYAIQPATPFLTHALPFNAPEHATVSNLRLTSAALQALGYEVLSEPYTAARYPLQYEPTTAECQWIEERLHSVGITADTPLIIIHPGTGAAVKLWRNAAWIHIANQLADQRQVRIVLTGSPSEQPMLQEIAQGVTPAPYLIGNTTVGQLAALLRRAQFVLGVDNGPLHLAVAQGTPTVQIFGPTDPRIFGPWGLPERHIVIASTEHCRACPAIPCGRLDFSVDELVAHPCVRLVAEERVLAAITTIQVDDEHMLQKGKDSLSKS